MTDLEKGEKLKNELIRKYNIRMTKPTRDRKEFLKHKPLKKYTKI